MIDKNYIKQLERDNELLREKLENASLAADKYFSGLKMLIFIYQWKKGPGGFTLDIESFKKMYKEKGLTDEHIATILEVNKKMSRTVQELKEEFE